MALGILCIYLRGTISSVSSYGTYKADLKLLKKNIFLAEILWRSIAFYSLCSRQRGLQLFF